MTMGDPDYIVAFQDRPEGRWNLQFQWGKSGPQDPKPDRSTNVHRLDSFCYRASPKEVFEMAKRWPYDMSKAGEYVCSFKQKKPSRRK